MAETERLHSVEEIANHIGVSKDTIRAWIKKEAIPFYKVVKICFVKCHPRQY